MNKLARYVIGITLTAVICFLVWYFQGIVAYILISAVLSLIGKPLVDLLGKVPIYRWRIPRALSAAVTLMLLWFVIVLFFRIFIPLVANQATQLSSVNIPMLVETFSKPIAGVERFIQENIPAASSGFSVDVLIEQRISSVLNVAMLTNLFSSIASMLGNLFVAAFSISFITFFFLKDDKLFFEGLLLVFPEKYEENVTRALDSIKNLLTRYFIGIVLDVLCIITLVTVGHTIVGIPFTQALVIGLLAGVLNVIPYVGPILAALLGILIGVATNLETHSSTQLVHLAISMGIVYIVVDAIDAFFFQPFIYSSSVNAHPLEIFLVILVAGSVAGIAGMLLAIPFYTVLRVFAKEFFYNFRVVKKLTGRFS
ncbi:AI-2E family transporter [Williamwhitmania taraxaci]|uniref:Predicted PurR-regulated permease PerM n=1 Tax=Williamwhitmania taraxaci TaxID=1640674 RepID=A0A1G6LE85_9BACT|nr:AI-2E family transporter [Williamwhitmania taraxaci]SDC41549.1 Predicted PurR-regulated permease PerM [Williamwhitmania taraxaci]